MPAFRPSGPRSLAACASDAGFLVANELFDALPFRLLEWPDEVVVGAGKDGRLREERRPATPELAAALQAEVEPRAGGRYAVRPDAPGVLLELAATLSRGRTPRRRLRR